MINSKIALGGAQFGLDYGINNDKGKIPPDEANRILNKAAELGIDTIDTAHAYGESESVIGKYIKQYGQKFKIISKLPECSQQDAEFFFNTSQERLNIDAFYGYLLHSFKHFRERPEIWDFLGKLKSQRRIQKIGFSLYYPADLDILLKNNVCFDIVQVPYSILDQRFVPYFAALKKAKVEIHVRSIFLQGLVFKDSGSLDNKFSKLKKTLSTLHSYQQQLLVPYSSLFLNFVALNTHVDKIVIGIDGMDNLIENVENLRYVSKVAKIQDALGVLKESDENIIIPSNW